ncbi:MAG: DEAD/DEAH box helicase [Methylococcaceae bacterium]|nr:DEAD/DEAH box helicase [Methylococcaceae bacterium]MDZ4156387.1 DEAD/DEAH box helicase [Methylococcales bacterium]MDP2394648.1 DEAD/DEAH box helicase [Methylococcaceae bacterium]MDP3019116.1 DEAD/DEAH box helicase [Methylococcaceae bacterium]MDP3390332.1 DEAD/DEAH box helicase [Methylococcaceae bacterium]
MSFQTLGLTEDLLKAVTDQGYKTPTPVQQKAIPLILEGRDVLAGAQTGTGKTASFTLPLLQRLTENHNPAQKPRRIRALILVPTRELAAQVYESVKTYGAHLPFHTELVVGGASVGLQVRQLRRGCDIVVATPGRLIDHIRQRVVSLANIEILVLDEADRMLDMGFLPDIKQIMALLPKQRQSLLFSATVSNGIKSLASQLLNNPAEVEVAKQNATADTVSERVYGIPREVKRELLSYLIGSNNWKQVLVFVRTKHGADRLEKQLIEDGIRSVALHGDKTQGARNKALEYFKTGKVSVLVATDVASRGLDIDDLPHVVNFDLPQVPEDYVHRIGRTGRAGASGVALSLVCPEDAYLLVAIEQLLKRQIPRVADTGYQPVSLKVNDAPKKHAPNKDTGKKDFRHSKKPAAKAGKPAAGGRDGAKNKRKPAKPAGKGRG